MRDSGQKSTMFAVVKFHSCKKSKAQNKRLRTVDKVEHGKVRSIRSWRIEMVWVPSQ